MAMKIQKHPGILLKETLIDATGLSVTEAAERLGISRTALSRILNGHANITPQMAVRLSKFFNTSIEMWIHLQANYDVYLIKKTEDIFHVRPLRAA